MFVLRALLGLAEAAFSPGLPFVLSAFYLREELALRIGLIIAAAPLAASFASSLAWVITKAGEHVPIAAWRLLFLVEGAPAVFLAIVVWLQIPDSPDKAGYLSRREKRVASLRLESQKRTEKSLIGKNRALGMPKLDFGEIGQALKDVKCWITAVRIHTESLLLS